MTQILYIHPVDPQIRLLRQAAFTLKQGGVVVYPTDSSYALGCCLGESKALARIRSLRNLEQEHNFTLVCRNLSEIASYAHVDNSTYRLLKAHTPGPYTFILPASKEVPRRLQHPKRKSIGLRIPDNKIVQMLLAELEAPLMSVSFILPGDKQPVAYPEEVYPRLTEQVDLIIDSGFGGVEETTVVDFVSGTPQVIRAGKGDSTLFL